MLDGGLYGYLGEGDRLLAGHAGLPPEGVRAPHWSCTGSNDIYDRTLHVRMR